MQIEIYSPLDKDRHTEKQTDRQTLRGRLTRYLLHFKKGFVILHRKVEQVTFFSVETGDTVQALLVANHVRIRAQRPDCEQELLFYHWKGTITDLLLLERAIPKTRTTTSPGQKW